MNLIWDVSNGDDGYFLTIHPHSTPEQHNTGEQKRKVGRREREREKEREGP